MKVSVIIPIYNVEAYLKECLDSIVGQTFSDYEIICVNDCSPDNCVDILEEYKAKYSNIKVITNPKNEGLSYSRNIGLENASGKYVLFVDSDDYIKENTLEVLYSQAEANELEVVYFNKYTIYEGGWAGGRYQEKHFISKDTDICNGREIFIRFMKESCFKSMNAYTQFFLRDFLVKNNIKFYNGIIHEDYLFFFLCAMKAERVLDLNEAYYVYRIRKNSITTEITELHKQSIFITLMEVLAYWRNNKFSKQENAAIKEFARNIYGSCKKYYECTNFKDELSFGEAADQFLYEKMMNNEYIYFTSEEFWKMNFAKKIWIYGAGNVGHEAAVVLERNRIPIEGYLVTDATQNSSSCFGWKVHQFNKLKIDKNDLIIVAMDGKAKIEVQKKLEQKGYMNIICAIKENKLQEEL